jgi:hypothetical protein
MPTHSHTTRVGENGVDVRVVPDAVTYRGGDDSGGRAPVGVVIVVEI